MGKGNKNKGVSFKEGEKSQPKSDRAATNTSTTPPTKSTQVNKGGKAYNNRGKKGKQVPAAKVPSSTFKGETEELEDVIFDIGAVGQVDKYAKGIKRFCNYVTNNYDYGSDVRYEIENLTEFQVPMPADLPTGASNVQERLLNEQIKNVARRIERLSIN